MQEQTVKDKLIKNGRSSNRRKYSKIKVDGHKKVRIKQNKPILKSTENTNAYNCTEMSSIQNIL